MALDHNTCLTLSSFRKRKHFKYKTNTNHCWQIINQLKTRVAVVEQEVKDKDELLKKTSDLLAAGQQQNVIMLPTFLQLALTSFCLDNNYLTLFVLLLEKNRGGSGKERSTGQQARIVCKETDRGACQGQ